MQDRQRFGQRATNAARFSDLQLGDSRTSLVNTRILLSDAPEADRSLFRRLVDLRAIEGKLPDHVPFSLGLFFPVREGFVAFDAATDERSRPRIHGVGIEVTGHKGRNDKDGSPSLVKCARGANGLLFNFEDYFVVTCPACGHPVKLGDRGSDFMREAFEAWRAGPETASMKCPACERATPIRDWRSATDTFAAGHLAFTL